MIQFLQAKLSALMNYFTTNATNQQYLNLTEIGYRMKDAAETGILDLENLDLKQYDIDKILKTFKEDFGLECLHKIYLDKNPGITSIPTILKEFPNLEKIAIDFKTVKDVSNFRHSNNPQIINSNNFSDRMDATIEAINLYRNNVENIIINGTLENRHVTNEHLSRFLEGTTTITEEQLSRMQSLLNLPDLPDVSGETQSRLSSSTTERSSGDSAVPQNEAKRQYQP